MIIGNEFHIAVGEFWLSSLCYFYFFFTWGQVGLDESYFLNEMIIRKSAFCVCLGYRLILKHHHQT